MKLLVQRRELRWLTREITFGKDVCDLVFGVKITDLDLWAQIDSVKQPIQSNSVGSWNMSHCGTSAFDNHLDHCLIVFKDIQQSFLMRRVDVWGNKINITQIIDHSLKLLAFLNCVRCWTNSTFVIQQVAVFFSVLIRVSKNCNDQIPQIRSGNSIQPQSSVQRDDFWFCWTVRNWSLFFFFKHIQLIGTSVWLPKTHTFPPEVDFESSRCPAKSESWNSPSLHCLAVLPAWQYCL